MVSALWAWADHIAGEGRSNMAVTKDIAKQRYETLYTILNDGAGKSGLQDWEKTFLSQSLDNYTRTRILGRNLAMSRAAFSEHLFLVVPPDRMLDKPTQYLNVGVVK